MTDPTDNDRDEAHQDDASNQGVSAPDPAEGADDAPVGDSSDA